MPDTTSLPTWDDMPDADKGAALVYLAKVDTESRAYAREHHSTRYLIDPALKALDKQAASDHAESLFANGTDDAVDLLGENEFDRLYDLAIDYERTHC
ncbi:hypothetical protein ETD86_40905 [Nonomuraea turkmeniaca]|uniref:Uncharacterized protein n=1 Tax=Nonomuraea turkmeniaca TaxID=103838 RepID=A0A5S4F1V9_9ACTN|nr:hypothetical protein [Nonomuraea turkmeniaca]TMR10087.1 hypothetical protein ETD86_40905 [Nonomuraea turkmeniaca]